MNIFIDYCPAAAIQRKVKWEERDIELITRMVSAAIYPEAACSHGLRRQRRHSQGPPPHTPSPPPPHWIWDRLSVTSPAVEDGLHFGDCEYDS
jgi:hypothetical protein